MTDTKKIIPSSSYTGAAAIYVHWPFCLKKCPYCDFNSHVRDEVSHQDWRSALVREIDTFAEKFPNISASSIFFGGGTPSLMEPETVKAVIDRIQKHWGPIGATEITMEANPSSVEAGRFKAYREAGVNRLSMGVQSLHDDQLKFLGRLHNAAEALKALEVARSTFDRVSIDLIYARPEQTQDQWRAELEQALSFDLSHLSLYQLTIEEGTAFYHQFKRGKFTLPDEDAAAALYDLTQEITNDAGLPAYEISNHARIGEESQHNLSYWQGDYYLGIGPGAHGRAPMTNIWAHGRAPACDTGAATGHAQIKRPEDWLKAVNSTGLGLSESEHIPVEDRRIEAVMMGLRLIKGIDKAGFERRFGAPLSSVIEESADSFFKHDGYITETDSHYGLTPKGLPLLNFILGKILA